MNRLFSGNFLQSLFFILLNLIDRNTIQFQSSSNDPNSMIKKKDFVIKSNEKMFADSKIKTPALHSFS